MSATARSTGFDRRDEGPEQRIVESDSESDLARVREPGVQAVIVTPRHLPAWIETLRECVRSGSFRLVRTLTPYLQTDEVEGFLENALPSEGVPAEVRSELIRDVRSLVSWCARVTDAREFRLRYMTATPDLRHGFHVDIAHSLPARRILRVYGDGTEYAEPENVKSLSRFYMHVLYRAQLAERVFDDENPPSASTRAYLLERLRSHDEEPGFLKDSRALKRVPVGSIVAIESVDRRQLWPRHIRRGGAAGWIHRSPMKGERRLLVSVSNAPS